MMAASRPAQHPHALLHSLEAAVAQVLQMVQSQTVTTLSGKIIPVKAETICIHSDGPNAPDLAKAVHHALTSCKDHCNFSR